MENRNVEEIELGMATYIFKNDDVNGKYCIKKQDLEQIYYIDGVEYDRRSGPVYKYQDCGEVIVELEPDLRYGYIKPERRNSYTERCFLYTTNKREGTISYGGQTYSLDYRDPEVKTEEDCIVTTTQ